MSTTASAPPLDGLKVVEFATMVAGPACGKILGDLGASVVKIEPMSGDPLRQVRPHHNGLSALFVQHNRNKRSLALDLKSAQGIDVARRLALEADVLVENNRAGVMDRLGLGYEALSAGNPGLVYVTISGFGQNGPYAERPAYDHLMQAMSGIMWQPGAAAPQPIRNAIVDKAAAMSAANGALAALLFRDRNGGRGQRVDVSLLDSFAAFGLPDLLSRETFRSADDQRIPGVNIYQPVQTADGWVMGHIQLRPQFEAMARVFGRADLIDDPRFAEPTPLVTVAEAIWAELRVGALKRTTSEVMTAAQRSGAPLAPINDIAAFMDDPQVRHNGTMVDIDDPDFGIIRQAAFPAALSISPARVDSRAPRLSEGGEDVLRELGFDTEAIEGLKAAKIVR